MDGVAAMRSLVEYDQALWRRIWESIYALSEETFTQELGYSHGSIRNQMVHVAATQSRWLRAVQQDAAARSFRPQPADYRTKEEALAFWEKTSADLAGYVAELSDGDLERVPRGRRGPVWQVLMHLVNHGTDHRAQVLRALHDFGAPTFDQDLIMHLWSR